MSFDWGEFGYTERIDCLRGAQQPCPICDNLLKLRHMPGVGESYWYCPSCGTEWNVVDLIAAYNNEET